METEPAAHAWKRAVTTQKTKQRVISDLFSAVCYFFMSVLLINFLCLPCCPPFAIFAPFFMEVMELRINYTRVRLSRFHSQSVHPYPYVVPSEQFLMSAKITPEASSLRATARAIAAYAVPRTG
jgi:hypothetical protein